MRLRLFAVVGLLFSLVLQGQAQKRSLDAATKVAKQFFQTDGRRTSVDVMRLENGRDGGRKLLRTAPSAQASGEAYYLFASEADGRLLIVSGDERMPCILGYTDQALRGQSLPDGLTDLLESYQAQYGALSKTTDTPARSALYKGERLLPTAEWGQWAPFNQMTPQAYPTGCAATAMAIVMRYHQWPLVGEGDKTHIWKDSVMTAHFGQTHYDWEHMPLSYTNYTAEQAQAVALLMRHAGISVEMYYDAESSGARQTLVPVALSQYFRYASTARLLNASDYDAATWDAMMRREIDADRPVIYTGESRLGRGAHGFVLDGYRDNLFHFNFGWNGSGNGYFAISAMTSTDGKFEFANKQQAVVGISPLKDDCIAPFILECQNDYVGFYTTLTTLFSEEETTIHLSNLTACRNWTGRMHWDLCHADGTKVESLGEQSVSMNGGSTQSLDFDLKAGHSAVEGDYLQLMALEDTAKHWRPVVNARQQEVKVSAYGRKVPVVHVVCDLKNVTFSDRESGNVCFDGKPLLGSTYRYQATFDKNVVKTLVQERLGGDAHIFSFGQSVVLTSDTLFVKAKGYTAAELVGECTVDVAEAGQLSSSLEKVAPDADAVETLILTGCLSDDDLQYLSMLQSLRSLDLENAATPQGIFGAPFRDFIRLKTCKLPRSLKQLGSETFSNCRALQRISLPVSLQTTGTDLFNGCRDLTDIYVHPSSPECVGTDAFRHLPNPEKVTIHVQQGLAETFRVHAKWSGFTRFVDDLPALPRKFTSGGIDYNAIYQGDGNYAEVAIPNGQMYVGAITIPATVTYQGVEYTVSGFESTDGLSPFVGNPFVTSLDLQLRVDTLRSMQFMGCTNLASLKLPPTLRYIANECFRNCPMLTQISLPSTVEALGDNAFCGCQYLTDIYCYAQVPPGGSNTDSYPFAQCRPQHVTLHVPESLETVYRTAGFWSRFTMVVGDLPADDTGVGAALSAVGTSFPIKAAGKQWLVLQLDHSQCVRIYRLDGTLQRIVHFPQGRIRLWLDETSILVAP